MGITLKCHQRPLKSGLILSAAALFFVLITACKEKSEYYTSGDFLKVPKTDVHLHIRSTNPFYMEFAARYNFRVVSPNVDSGPPWEEHLDTAVAIFK